MDTIQIKDKKFTVSIKEQDILKEVTRVANEINRDLAGKNPLFLSVLNGSFMFAADLFKVLELTDAEISFLKLASYEGTTSSGELKQLIGLNENIKGRTVVVLEDIVDSGHTITDVVRQIEEKGAKEVKVATLLFKPAALKTEVKLDYVGLEIPNDFIVGYGLDYDRRGRNLKDIYTLVKE